MQQKVGEISRVVKVRIGYARKKTLQHAQHYSLPTFFSSYCIARRSRASGSQLTSFSTPSTASTSWVLRAPAPLPGYLEYRLHFLGSSSNTSTSWVPRHRSISSQAKFIHCLTSARYSVCHINKNTQLTVLSSLFFFCILRFITVTI